MAKKEARISINKLESVVNRSVTTVPLAGSENTEIKIRFNLPLGEVLQFVEDVVSSCVDMENATYTPEIMWFSIYSSVLTRYANFNLPTNVEKQYDLIYNTDAVEQVMPYINKQQYDEIIEAIQARISHECAVMENSAIEKINDLVSRMNAYVAQSEAMFGGVDNADMSSLVRNLADIGKIDEEKLIKALVAARNTENVSDMATDDEICEQEHSVAAVSDVVEVQRKK